MGWNGGGVGGGLVGLSGGVGWRVLVDGSGCITEVLRIRRVNIGL
jgi:hypothetical protein